MGWPTAEGPKPLGLVVLKAGVDRPQSAIEDEVVALVRGTDRRSPGFRIALVVERLPKTRSGKILRGTMRHIADGEVGTDRRRRSTTRQSCENRRGAR